MRTRVQLSTDIAAFGIWDGAAPEARAGDNARALDALAQRGEACVIQMGGDCGGAAEIFVDEDLPADLLSETVSVPGERTVMIRSGEVVVDGAEYCGAREESAAVPARFRVPNGIYVVSIRIIKNEDELPEPASETAIRRVIGAGEVAFYDRMNRNGLLIGLSTLLLAPVLLSLTRWFIAIPVTVAVFISYFHVLQWLLRRDSRYQAIAEKIVPLRLSGDRPLLAIQMSKSDGPLRGGAALVVPDNAG